MNARGGIAERECPHGLGSRDWCSICKNESRGVVYLTGGGTAYHRTRYCTALVEGQEVVLRRGGTTERIRAVAYTSVELNERWPCKTCRPDPV